MSIRAVIKDGQLRLVDPLPSDWDEGQELTIEAEERQPTKEELDAWLEAVQRSAEAIPAEEHDRFQHALAEAERESKQATRRAWGLE